MNAKTKEQKRIANAKTAQPHKSHTKMGPLTNTVLDVKSHARLQATNPIVTHTKTNRNQVSANWSNVANSFKTQRTISPTKKLGKLY